MEKWSELRTALHVAQLGTVSAAATVLGLHRATVNRHIDALEKELGAKIFLRHSRGYSLTEIGEDVLRVALTTKNLTDDLLGRVQGKKESIEGEIRLTLLAPFVGLMLGPIDAFKTEHPNCLVAIDTTEDMVRLEYGEAHIAIRADKKPENPDYVVQSLGTVPLNLYAHNTYRERFGLPSGPGDLTGHRFIAPHAEDRRLPFWPWIEENVRPEMIVMSSRDIWLNVEAISRGLGMGFLGDHEAVSRKNLHPVLAPDDAWSVDLWLTTHVDLHRSDKVQAMLKCIKAEFGRP
ncbi:MAG: LysR family transcriptional regulator [Pseudomonadota bacterium]